MKPEVYFEKQSALSQMCGLHAINNLLGKQVLAKKDMDNICESLSPDIFNPHKHFFGGDYDVNVILIALQRNGLEGRWIDKRASFEKPTDDVVGYIVNKTNPKGILSFILNTSSRHWFTIRRQKKKNTKGLQPMQKQGEEALKIKQQQSQKEDQPGSKQPIKQVEPEVKPMKEKQEHEKQLSKEKQLPVESGEEQGEYYLVIDSLKKNVQKLKTVAYLKAFLEGEMKENNSEVIRVSTKKKLLI